MKVQGSQPVGIVGYGAYVPRLIITAAELEAAQGKTGSGVAKSLGVHQKRVPEPDEDTITMATAAADQALTRWGGQRDGVGAVFVGSESHPYAVKPSGTIVAQALGLGPWLSLADLQFACKAGTQAVQIGAGLVGSGMMNVALGIGADTAQAKPGDVLEFTAAAGAAAYLLGRENVLAELVATVSYATDTPDFWRRPGQQYPQHAGRFTGEPAYFHHVMAATKKLLAEEKVTPAEIDWCVFHTPNAKFPQAVAKKLGFKPEQLAPSLVVPEVGNTYAGASLLALAAVLDQAGANQTILMTSYGSGAGADAFLWRTTELLPQQRASWTGLVRQQLETAEPVSYQTYRQHQPHH